MIRWPMLIIFGRRLKAIKYFIKDKNVAFWKKLLIGFATIYLFTPIDLIPIVFFPIAWMDDLFLWICVIWLFKDELDSYGEQGNVDLSKKYQEDIVIEDVDFQINEDEEKKDEGLSR